MGIPIDDCYDISCYDIEDFDVEGIVHDQLGSVEHAKIQASKGLSPRKRQAIQVAMIFLLVAGIALLLMILHKSQRAVLVA